MEIGIEKDHGKIVSYKIDAEILNGLYQTTELKKIKENCSLFEIEIDDPKEGMISSKISKRENLCIATLKFDKKNHLQFLVGNDLDLKELNAIPKAQMPEEFKSLIAKAYHLTKKTTLKDL